MGKAANNEIRKLRATFCNNVAVGCFLGGFLIPWFSSYSNSELVHRNMEEFFTKTDFSPAIGVVLGCSLALLFHGMARKIAAKIED